jgi:hypothetical protein
MIGRLPSQGSFVISLIKICEDFGETVDGIAGLWCGSAIGAALLEG